MKLFDAAPEYGEPVALDEGLWWLRLQLPFALNHVNLCWPRTTMVGPWSIRGWATCRPGRCGRPC